MKKDSINRWIILSFALILLMSIAMSAAINYYEAYNNAMRETGAQAQIFSDIVSQLFNHRWHMDRQEMTVRSDDYISARKTLQSLCQQFRMDYVSVYRVDPEMPSRYFYFFVASNEEEDQRLLQENSLRTISTTALQPGEQALLDGERELQPSRVKGRYKGEMVWFAPCCNERGELQALIGMDYNLTRIRDAILHNFLVDVIPFSLSLLLGMLILLFLVRRRITVPVSQLSERIKRFALDSREKPEPLQIPYHDEIREMADSFDKMTEDISVYVNNIEKLTHERTETETQMEMARRIQNGLQPEKSTLSGDAFSVSAVTRPAKAVGGDFYDCYLRDENSVCIVMGDVSGKGVSAAISMAMIKTVIREKLMAGLSPAETLNRTNDQLCARNPENQFATAFVAVLNIETGELCYANAGHTPPVLLKDEPSILIPECGIALGVFEDADLQDATLTLPPDQGILLYTDGVTEALNPQHAFFGEEGLLHALRGFSARTDSAEEAVLLVSRAVSAFCDGCEPFDDMALLALMYRGGRGWKSLPVALNAFDEVRETIFAAAGDTSETRRALLACDEVLANIVSYSEAKNLSFLYDREDGQLRVSFSDDGKPFDPVAFSPEEREFEALDSGGMGLNLIAQTVSSIRYERTNGRNVLTLFFPLQDENTSK